MLPFPEIDPIALQLGPLAIRWYALAYVAGILLGWWVVIGLNKRPIMPGMVPGGAPSLPQAAIDDMVTWAVLGIILGGRLGYVLFYNLPYYAAHPLEALHIWQGGMSFHGGLIGVLVAFWLFARRHKVPYFVVMDLLAVATPIGICFGRIANFINGELFGRVSDVPWAMVFPHGGPEPRHPSQLYEAALEGVVLFMVLYVLARFTAARARIGLLSGIFLLGYSGARMLVEQFREPDAQLGFLFAEVTMGQLLSLPMWAYGAYLIVRALRREPRKERP